MTFSAVIFAVRAYYREPSSDELVYRYVWEPDDPTGLWEEGHRFEREVSSFSDILSTQSRHYMRVNGRAIVHTLEQAFTGHELAFAVFASSLFVAFVALIVGFSLPEGCRSYGYWLLTSVALLYLFPYCTTLWTSVNYGMNYLYPGVLCMAFLWLWKYVGFDGHRLGRLRLAGAIALALLFGWSNEAYVLGVDAGMFLYYCFNSRRFRGQIVVLAVVFWFSSAALVFSPGNFLRLTGPSLQGIPLKESVYYAISHFLELRVWLLFLVATALMLVFRRSELLSVFRRNSYLLYVFASTIVISLVANTKDYSHVLAVLLSLVFILKYISVCRPRMSPPAVVALVLCSAVYVLSQTLIARDTVRVYRMEHELIKEYRASSDGLVRIPPVEVSPLSRPFIAGPYSYFDRKLSDYFMYVINLVYCNSRKPPIFLEDADMYALVSPQTFFTPANKMPGNAPAYHVPSGRYIWLSQATERPLSLTYRPVSFSTDGPMILRIKYIFIPEKFSNSDTIIPDTLHTRYGTALRIPAIINDREVVAVDI